MLLDWLLLGGSGNPLRRCRVSSVHLVHLPMVLGSQSSTAANIFLWCLLCWPSLAHGQAFSNQGELDFILANTRQDFIDTLSPCAVRGGRINCCNCCNLLFKCCNSCLAILPGGNATAAAAAGVEFFAHPFRSAMRFQFNSSIHSACPFWVSIPIFCDLFLFVCLHSAFEFFVVARDVTHLLLFESAFQFCPSCIVDCLPFESAFIMNRRRIVEKHCWEAAQATTLIANAAGLWPNHCTT